MAKYPGTLESANPSEFGIVFAEEVAGHKTVATLTELYALSDAILSKSKNNTNNDALGQDWYVREKSLRYRLTDWSNRHNENGWTALTESSSVAADLKDHVENENNPHNVTKSQVGLGNVDNTSDQNKPISTATQEALNAKVPNTRKVAGHALSSDVTLSKGDVGLGNVDNTADSEKSVKKATQDGSGNVITETYVKDASFSDDKSKLKLKKGNNTETEVQVPIVTRETPGFLSAEDKVKLDGLTPGGEPNKVNGVKGSAEEEYREGYISISPENLGLGNVDNTSDKDKPISTATKVALDNKVDKTTTVNGHALSENVEVTKSDVGLGNVDNTSDADKPISTATQEALDNINEDLSAHKNNKDNPHQVTKQQVGLGRVDNTTDAQKPISKATQAALNEIIDDASWKGTLTTVVKHAIGIKANYDATTYVNVLYFTTDTSEIILNNVSYGLSNLVLSELTNKINLSVKQVTYVQSSRKFVFTLNNRSKIETTLPISTQSIAGLMSNTDKVRLDSIHSSIGVAGGIATLDSSGKLTSSQLPGSVSQILEFESRSNFPESGEDDKIYVSLNTRRSYRWSGTLYIEIPSSLALGETQGTAYEGNKGKKNADDIAALQTEFENYQNSINRVYDGGTASSQYGGARVINCGGAADI